MFQYNPQIASQTGELIFFIHVCTKFLANCIFLFFSLAYTYALDFLLLLLCVSQVQGASSNNPLEVVKDESFPNAVGIAATDPARVEPDQDYFAVNEGEKRW